MHNITLKDNVVKTASLKVCSTLGLAPTEKQDASEFYEVQFWWCPHPEPLNTLFPGWDKNAMSRMWWNYQGGQCRANGFDIAHISWPLRRFLPQRPFLPSVKAVHSTRSMHLPSHSLQTWIFLCVPEILSVIIWRMADSQKNTKVVVPDRNLKADFHWGTTRHSCAHFFICSIVILDLCWSVRVLVCAVPYHFSKAVGGKMR